MILLILKLIGGAMFFYIVYDTIQEDIETQNKSAKYETFK